MVESTRAYIYRVILALLPILTTVGAITDSMVPLIIGLVGAILSTGLATANTSTK